MPALVPLDSTYGAMLIGAMVSVWLFGTSVVQLYVYFSRFPNDPLWIKSLVSVLMAIDVAQAAFMGHLMYTVLVTNWGDLSSLDIVPWSLHAETIANAVVVFIVQCFFIRRIWVLSGHKHWLVVIFSAVALITLGGAMFFGINGAGNQLYSRFHEHTPVLIMWSVSDMSLDGAIAGLLCYYLHKSRSGIRKSDGMIDTLIIFTVNTGLLTFSATALHLVFFVASPTTGVHFAFHFTIAKLYTNSLYGSLNTRLAFRGRGERDVTVSAENLRVAGQSGVDSLSGTKYGTSASGSHAKHPIQNVYISESQGTFSTSPGVGTVHTEKQGGQTSSGNYNMKFMHSEV